MEGLGTFPKNLAFSLKKLQGSVIKTKISINSDRSSYAPNDRPSFSLPIGRIIDNRSVTLTGKCTAATGNHFPRGGLNSLIENFQISANSRVIQSTQYYNYIWNTLADVSGYFSPEQAGKRLYENFDPSIAHTNRAGEGVPAITINTTTITGAEVQYLSVNTWLGFFSGSAPTWNTNDIGQVILTLTLAPNSCMYLGAGAAGTGVAVGDYKIEELTLSMDTITFTNSLYSELIKEKLEGDGLNIGYNDYLVATGSLFTKTANGSCTTVAQFSTNSLDAVYGTFRNKDYNTASALLLSDAVTSNVLASIVGSTKTYAQVLADPVGAENNHGGFNQSIYFQRAGGAIDSSSWYINSQPFTVNSTPVAIYNNLLQCLDYANVDISCGGFHAGAMTTGFYNKNYFVDALSLENLSGDNSNWVAGLSGGGGIISVQYTAKFSAASVESGVYPMIIGKVSKVMNVKFGRNIDITE